MQSLSPNKIPLPFLAEMVKPETGKEVQWHKLQ